LRWIQNIDAEFYGSDTGRQCRACSGNQKI